MCSVQNEFTVYKINFKESKSILKRINGLEILRFAFTIQLLKNYRLSSNL